MTSVGLHLGGMDYWPLMHSIPWHSLEMLNCNVDPTGCLVSLYRATAMLMFMLISYIMSLLLMYPAELDGDDYIREFSPMICFPYIISYFIMYYNYSSWLSFWLFFGVFTVWCISHQICLPYDISDIICIANEAKIAYVLFLYGGNMGTERLHALATV